MGREYLIDRKRKLLRFEKLILKKRRSLEIKIYVFWVVKDCNRKKEEWMRRDEKESVRKEDMDGIRGNKGGNWDDFRENGKKEEGRKWNKWKG